MSVNGPKDCIGIPECRDILRKIGEATGTGTDIARRSGITPRKFATFAAHLRFHGLIVRRKWAISKANSPSSGRIKSGIGYDLTDSGRDWLGRMAT